MIFAYSNGGENKGATEGRIKAIYYDSSDPFTPVKVVLNTDYQDNGGEGDEFQISGSELQYLFSVYGEFEVDDKVALCGEERKRRKCDLYGCRCCRRLLISYEYTYNT